MNLDFTNEGSMNWDQLENNLGAAAKGVEKKSWKDDRFWKLAQDENKNGAAIIRLLLDPTAVPFILRYSHSPSSFDKVNNKKRWYLNVSPQTINEKCPASEFWSLLYNAPGDEAKVEAKKFSRKIKFMTNIKVIKDPANPENEGKIFLWEFGTKLKDKFYQALNPSETDRSMGEQPKELFHPLIGCNIKLKIKMAAGFPTYDDTTIEPASSIYEDGAAAKEDILKNAYRLDEFLKPDAFLTYEEYKKKLKWVIDAYVPTAMSESAFRAIANDFFEEPAVAPVATTGTPEVATTVQEKVEVETATPPVSGGDEDLSFLDGL